MPVLKLGSLGPVSYALRDLTGEMEYGVDETQPVAAAFWLAGKLVRLPENAALDTLPVALLHRLYLAIYRAYYSGPIQNVASCRGCGDSFEFALDLDDITAKQDHGANAVAAQEKGWWALSGGGRVRAPEHRDVLGENTGDLLGRICRGTVSEEAVSAFLDEAAPLLDFDIETACPHCDKTHQLRFNMPAYLVRKIGGDRPFLLREIHLIASQYRWSHAEILALRRKDRRDLAGLIQAERHQRRGLRAVS